MMILLLSEAPCANQDSEGGLRLSLILVGTDPGSASDQQSPLDRALHHPAWWSSRLLAARHPSKGVTTLLHLAPNKTQGNPMDPSPFSSFPSVSPFLFWLTFSPQSWNPVPLLGWKDLVPWLLGKLLPTALYTPEILWNCLHWRKFPAQDAAPARTLQPRWTRSIKSQPTFPNPRLRWVISASEPKGLTVTFWQLHLSSASPSAPESDVFLWVTTQ